MATRYVSFSTEFPGYHPKKGEPTFFIEKIWSGLLAIHPEWYAQFLPGFNYKEKTTAFQTFRRFETKFHTVREGHRFKVGDEIIPFTWSGKPYRSKWVKPFGDGDLALPVERVWNFGSRAGAFYINEMVCNGEIESHHELLELIAANDGLSKTDFIEWIRYPKNIDCQIICWNAHIRYLDSDPKPMELRPPNPNRKIIKM